MDEVWYHGSPILLDTLAAGSTITRRRRLAEVFSHKPTIVSVDDEDAIRHDGTQPGYLYRIGEPVAPADCSPHPRSSMAPGWEWLTRRDLVLDMIGPVAIRDEERLSAEDVRALYAQMRAGPGSPASDTPSPPASAGEGRDG